MTTMNRTFAALAVLMLFATPVLAGPPLICHPFVTEGGKLITWSSGNGWNSPDPSYDVRKLIADTTAVLTPDAPTLTRMENLRRAAIYSMRDPVVARDLLKTMMNRALGTTKDDHAWFDAGYLIETYKQAMVIRELRNPAQPGWEEIEATLKIDGYNWVKKAMAMTSSSPEMEFAASLMTREPLAGTHRARALAGAPKGSALAKNLAANE